MKWQYTIILILLLTGCTTIIPINTEGNSTTVNITNNYTNNITNNYTNNITNNYTTVFDSSNVTALQQSNLTLSTQINNLNSSLYINPLRNNTWFNGAVTSQVKTNTVQANDTIRCYPMPTPKAFNTDEIRILANVVSATYPSNVTVGIYNDSGQVFPGVLIVNTSQNNIVSNGLQNYTLGKNYTIPAGLNWGCVAIYGNLSLRSIAAAGISSVLGDDGTNSLNMQTGWTTTISYTTYKNDIFNFTGNKNFTYTGSTTTLNYAHAEIKMRVKQ